MIILQKTFVYTGSNKEYLAKYFPNLRNISVEFLFSAPHLPQGESEENVPYDDFSKKISVPFKASVHDTFYQKKISKNIFTGSNSIFFFKNYIKSISGLELHFFGYVQCGDCQIELIVNQITNCYYRSLPFILFQNEHDRSFFIDAVMLSSMSSNDIESIFARRNINLDKYLDDNLILLNTEVLVRIARAVSNESLLFIFLSFSVSRSGDDIFLSIPTIDEFNILMRPTERVMEQDIYNMFCEKITIYFKELIDFPVRVPEINPVLVKGEIKFLCENSVKFLDLSNYDLSIDYQSSTKEEDYVPKFKTAKYKWNNFSEEVIPNKTALFDFYNNNDVVLDSKTTDTVTVWLKLFDGTVLWKNDFSSDDEQLANIHIEVPLVKSNPLGWTGNGLQNINLSLRGKVVEVTGKCSLKDLTVIIQAKVNKNDQNWRTVGTAVTDITGSFTMPYPLGAYEAAQAVVSITPDDPVVISVNADETHKAALQTISNEFLYLLVDADCSPCSEDKQKDGCSCNKTPRLPNQEDLINSDKFSQDLGGGTCVNLTTPNRTLSEQTYYAIVRTSDPDIANYVLDKQTNTDNDGFQKVIFSLGDGKKILRSEVAFENPIRWQDVPDAGGENQQRSNLSIYQAVTVAHGHLLHYKSVLKADGYSLGDLLYSLPLAPGQKKQIAVYDWKRSLQGSEKQQLVQRESINASVVNDRTLINDLAGSINESLRGQSSASTGGISAGLGISAMMGSFGGVLGVSGGYSSSSSQASQDSARNTVQSFNEVLRNSIMQSAASYRELNGTLIDTVTEGQQFSTTTEVISNHNHCHSLTMLYFEVLRHYAVYQELVQVEECIFVPLIMTEFTQANIRRYRDVLAANLLHRPSNTYIPLYFNQNPLVKAFDANERVLTNWTNVDYPVGSYCDETINSMYGSFSVRVRIPRPKTRFDRILSLPIIRKTVTSQDGVDIQGTIQDNIKSSVLAAATGGISLLFGGGPSVTYKTETKEVITRGQIFDLFMTLDENYESVPPAHCIRVHNFEPINIEVNGEMKRIDFFDDMPDDKRLWDFYAKILKLKDTRELLQKFSNNIISDWDKIFYADIAPLIIKSLISEDRISLSHFANIDLTALSELNKSEQRLEYRIEAVSTEKRSDIKEVEIKYKVDGDIELNTLRKYLTLTIEYISINYSTNHYNGRLYYGYKGSDLVDGTKLQTPLTTDEKRNPRKEDKFVINELIAHLNSNLEYYNRILWYNIDQDRRYLLLDGFHIQVYDDLNRPSVLKSLSSIVKNQLIGIAGNSLIFPVAAGVKVDRSYIIVKSDDIEERGGETRISLFDHYRPMTPPSPYRISVPTRGIFAEAVTGACDSCEKVKKDSSQDWNKFKTDEPTAIGTVTVPTPTPTDWKAAFKDFAQPIVNIQNAPPAPVPGAGLAGLSELLGKNGIFKDITGLDENQKNVLATYLSNQENAKAFAQMAKDMAMQSHNTENSDRIMTSLNDAKKSGAISQADYGKLVKEHLQQQIDGGESKKAEQEKEKPVKPSLTDAAISAVEKGQAVKASSSDGNGNAETLETGGKEDVISLKIDLSKNDAITRTFGGPSNKSGIITVQAFFENLPAASTIEWSAKRSAAIEIKDRNLALTQISSIEPGLTDLVMKVTSDKGVVLKQATTPLCVPQFFTIDEDKALFDKFLSDFQLSDVKNSVLQGIKSVCETLLQTCNLRLIWTLPPFNEKLPIQFTTGAAVNKFSKVVIKNDNTAKPGTVGEQFGPNPAAKIFNDTVELYPSEYQHFGADVSKELADFISTFIALQYNDIELKTLWIQVMSRMIGETMAHEILHSVTATDIPPFIHNDPPIANDILNKGGDRSFVQRTGIEIIDAVKFPNDKTSYRDSGFPLSMLTKATQDKVDANFPVPPKFI